MVSWISFATFLRKESSHFIAQLSELHSIKAWFCLSFPVSLLSLLFVPVQFWCTSKGDCCLHAGPLQIWTLALRYNQIFGTSSLPPPCCMLPAIEWLIHAESVRYRNHRTVEWTRAYAMVSLLASHVVCTSIRHAHGEKRCTGNLDYVQKLCMCSCIYKENLSIIQQQRHAHIYKET
jgi:hypothetical protein